MGIPRPRKRVRAIRRAPDGSAFQTCDGCGVSVAVALSDMHECETKKEEVKRFKGVCAKQNVIVQSSSSQPVSAFRLFMYDGCGVSVAVALSDMHECETKKEEVKRFKGVCAKQNVIVQSSSSQPVSAFRLFMESFVKICCNHKKFIDIDQYGFETWRNMSEEERQPYVYQAEVVSMENINALRLEEIAYMRKVDQEADSATVGKYDQGNDSDEDFREVITKILLDGSSSTFY